MVSDRVGRRITPWLKRSSTLRKATDDLFVDPASMQITREDGVTNFVLAHHHLSWLRQKQPFEDHLNDVAPVQLFGHVHTNRIVMERDWVRLTASATHPDRHETSWEPDTTRTSARDGLRFFHLSLVSDAGRRRTDLLITERAGEVSVDGDDISADVEIRRQPQHDFFVGHPPCLPSLRRMQCLSPKIGGLSHH
jgi:hypothetical protein